MGNGAGVFDITAGAIIPISSSLEASGNLNLRSKREKRLYNRLIQGRAKRSDVGEAPQTVINPTFSVSSSIFSYPNQLATPPSWTQRNIGLGHEFVTPALSSSAHEVSRLNAFVSGVFPLESSAVPARAPSFYSKQTKLVRKVYKLSASIDLPVTPTEIERFPFFSGSGFADGSGLIDPDIAPARGIWDSTSGSFRANSSFNPSIFEIFVPDYGKIRDIKVWVEFVHDVRRVSGSAGPNFVYYSFNGLSQLSIALRSPNVSFKSAHPVWNDPQVAAFKHRNSPWAPELTGSSNQFGSKYYEVSELLRSSYLLWEGSETENQSIFTNPGILSPRATWNTDIDMRTIFSDSSNVVAPRNFECAFTASQDLDPGPIIIESRHGTFHPPFFSASAPNSIAYTVASSSLPRVIAGVLVTPNPFGLRIPWIMDSRISSGTVRHRDILLSGGIASGAWSADAPPPGWLTGPGGTAGDGEFLTSGFNVGPTTIQPAYPLLDDIYGRGICNVASGTDKINRVCTGFRPGLRGSEVHGRWQLMIGVHSDFDRELGFIAQPYNGIWFRQFRLEFILDQGVGQESFYPSKSRRFKKTSYVATKPGKRRIHFYLGQAVFDVDTRVLFTEVGSEYGRSIGITDQTASNPENFAVFTRLTGAFADSVTGTMVPTTYLQNEFGTPYIPISSGSGIPVSFQIFTPEDTIAAKALTAEIIKPKTIVNRDNTVSAHIARARVIKVTRQTIADRLDQLQSSGSL